MKNISKTIAVGGAHILALGGVANATTSLSSNLDRPASSNQVQHMDEVQMRILEASHLQVPGTCKWGHAAFDPVKVENEQHAQAVLALYQQIETV